MSISDSKTALYRHFDVQGTLLYVGISLSVAARLGAHVRYSAWGKEVTRVDIEWFDTRTDALEAEKAAITSERPVFNILHNTDTRCTEEGPKTLKIYSSYLTKVFDMPRSTQKALGYILDCMNDENEITIASGGKTKMLEVLGMKPQTLNNALSLLVKNKVLSNPYKGVYIASPYVFTYKKQWGDVLNQQKKFNATIRYCGDASFTVKGGWV